MTVWNRRRVLGAAGSFNAFRVEARDWQTGILGGMPVNLAWDLKTWYAPDQVRQPVLIEWLVRAGTGKIGRSDRDELAEFRQS